MRRENLFTLCIAVLTLAVITAGDCAQAESRPKKKVIQYGWDIKYPDYIAENIREMEKLPFDGIMTRTRPDNFTHVFYNKTLDDKQTADYLSQMKSIKWKKFTDNFFMIWARSQMDWFSEEDWADDGWVLRNTRLCARAAKIGGCVGVAFDAEIYWGRNAWGYKVQPGADKRTFAEFEVMARKRGSQFMEALQDEFPDLVVYTLFLTSDPRMFVESRKETDPVKRSELIKPEFYALYPAFLNGMLDAIKGKTTLIDGNEYAFYYNTAKVFDGGFQMMREGVRNMYDDKAWAKYQKHARVSHSIYVDYICNLLPHRLHTSNLSPRGRARHAEFNIYHALRTADEYIWLYSEYMNWWEDVRVPEGLADAVVSARRKINSGQPLGFDIAEELNQSNSQMWVDRGAYEPRTATIKRLAAAKPVIDGKGDDAAWDKASPMGTFVAYVEAPEYDLAAHADAKVTYDDESLYVLFNGREPDMKGAVKGMVPYSFYGNDLDYMSVMLAPEHDRKAWRLFGTAIDGKRRDAHPDGEKANWQPDYQSAVTLGENGWAVEMAVPWKALDRAAPKPGEKLAANLAHLRVRPSVVEYATWSKFVGKRDNRPAHILVEPEKLGNWTFQ